MSNYPELVISYGDQEGNVDVLEFIHKFLSHNGEEQIAGVQSLFRAGYCYYFAHMLKKAFERGTVCWAAPLGHIVWCDDDGVPYDAEGVCTSEADYFIPESYLGNAVYDFKRVPGMAFCASQDDLNKIIQSYLHAHPELQKPSKSNLIDEFDRPLPESELLKNSVLKKGDKFQVFYHGTNDTDFETFSKEKIGVAHDRGWYGSGFYFCYTKGEAAYYGPYVREACLAISNPFYFTEELLSMEGQRTSIVGDMAVFAINLSEKFPSLAEKLSVSTVGHYDNDGNAADVKRIPLPEFSKLVLDVFHNPDFEIYECMDNNVLKYFYKMGEDYNAIRQEFRTWKEASEYRLDMAASYVMRRTFAHVCLHMPEYFMEQIAEEFTNELKDRNYDGILQSKHGDEAICFEPNQVIFCGKEQAQ